jgi:hypothetical protein
LAVWGVFAVTTTAPAAANSLGADAIDSFSRCELAISEVNQRTQNKYDPLSHYDYLQPVELKIRNVGSKKCSGYLSFESGAGNDKLIGTSGNTLNYLLVDEHNLGKILFNPQRYSQTRLSINLKAGRSVHFNPRLYIPRGQSAISGKYQSQIDVVYQGHKGSYRKRIPFHFGAHVRASVQANFVGVNRLRNKGRYGVVKLGELSPGLRRTFGLQLRSNSHVDVSVSSQNQGELAHKSLIDAGIGYSMRIGGNDIDLSSQTEVTLPADLSRNGLTNTIEVELDEYINAPAGRYRDLIHVRVSAR